MSTNKADLLANSCDVKTEISNVGQRLSSEIKGFEYRLKLELAKVKSEQKNHE